MIKAILDRYIMEQVISERFKLNTRNFAGLRFTFIKNLSCTVELELIKLPHYVKWNVNLYFYLLRYSFSNRLSISL